MTILVYVEQHGGTPASGSLAVLGRAREIATEAGMPLVAVVGGTGISALAQTLPADTVLVADDERFADATTAPLVDMLAAAVQCCGAGILLSHGSVGAADVVGGAAARLGVGVNMDATDVALADGAFVVHKPALDDSVVVRCGYTRRDGLQGAALFRGGSFAAAPLGSAGSVEVLEVPDAGRPGQQLLGIEEAGQGAGVDITQADVLVGAGRGLGGPEKFSLVESLAQSLGGEVATTRAVVDAGWYDYSTQVGQTGKTVSPKLYVAVGISGAIQHRIGMQSSGTIIAINKDPNAPIFDFADLSVVGDLFTIVPRLEAQLRERKG